MNAADLITQYIELNPHRPGLDEAWIKDYGIPVWSLIGYVRAVHGDIARISANDPDFDGLLHAA